MEILLIKKDIPLLFILIPSLNESSGFSLTTDGSKNLYSVLFFIYSINTLGRYGGIIFIDNRSFQFTSLKNGCCLT